MTVLTAVRERTGVRAVPAWAWLAGIVVVSALVRFAFARRMAAPWIMVDELIYSELAKSFAAGGEFLVRGEPATGYGFVYPVLIAPAWRAFAAVPDAYLAARAINGILFSLAAVPAFLLARRIVSERLALVAALLALAIPSALYSGTLMTENAFYPLTLLFALALVSALERPTAWRALVVLVVFGIAFETRAQAAAFLPAAVLAPLLAGRPWRRFRTFWAVLLAPAALAVLAEAARGRSPTALLGAYAAATESTYTVGGVLKWLAYHLIELDVYVAVVPVVAVVALLAARTLDERARAFLAATVAITLLLVAEVAVFAAGNAQRIEERNMFYVVPLLVIALLAWIQRGLPRGRWALGAAIVAGGAPFALPYASLIGTQAEADTLQAVAWWSLVDAGLPAGALRWLVGAVAAALAVAALLLPRRLALVFPVTLLAYFALTTAAVESSSVGVRDASLGALFQGIAKPDRDWVDAAVGRGADVAALHVDARNRDAFQIWENEFFSRSVGSVYDVGIGPLPGNLPETQVRVDRGNGLLLADGRPVRHEYALTTMGFPLVGSVVARDEIRAVTLYRPDGPLRVAYTTTGIYADTWSGPTATWRGYACDGGHLTAHVQQDPSLFSGPQTVRAAGRSFVVRGDGWITVPLQAENGRCEVRFTVSPTKVPGPQDTRRLGIHFTEFHRTP